jgi:uncharacterized protein
MKAVLDTNPLVSALLQPRGPGGQIVLRWQARQFELAVSRDILTELADVLHRPHIIHKHTITESDIANYLNYLRDFAEVAAGSLVLDVVPDDPKDNHVVAAAVETYCDYLVSGDRHLLDLHEFQGVKILSPREFLMLLAV